MNTDRFRTDDKGSTLVMAIVFLLAIGLVILALGDFAVQSASTNISVRAQAKVEAAAESAATAAIQQVRVSWQYPQTGASTTYSADLKATPSAYQCNPSGVTTAADVVCEGWQVGTSRLVDFFVCGSTYYSGASDPLKAANCQSHTELFASVTYQDIPDGGSPNSASCTSSSNATCGIRMNIGQWDVRISDS